MASIVVARRHLDADVSEAELLIDRHLSPRARVAGVRPGVLLPGVQSELTRFWDGVEDPQTFPGKHVIPADIALHIGLAGRNAAWFVGCAHHNGISGHQPGRMPADIP